MADEITYERVSDKNSILHELGAYWVLNRDHNITHLHISGPNSRSFPEEILSQMQHLRVLRMWETPVTDNIWRHIAMLAFIEVVGTVQCELRGVGLSALVNCSNLRELDLRITNCDDQSIQEVAQLRQIEKLNLVDTRVSQLNFLIGLDQLREFSICNPKIRDADIIPLSQCKNLRSLALLETSITDDAMDIIGCLEQLEVLEIHQTLITNNVFKRLGNHPHLRVLYTETIPDDEDLAHLAQYAKLEELYLAQEITPQRREEIRGMLPNVGVY